MDRRQDLNTILKVDDPQIYPFQFSFILIYGFWGENFNQCKLAERKISQKKYLELLIVY